MSNELWIRTNKAPEEEGQYVVIAQAQFEADGVKPGMIFVFVAEPAKYYDAKPQWVGFNAEVYDVICYRKLSNVALCIPSYIEGMELNYW